MECAVATVVAGAQDVEATYALVTDADDVIYLQTERRIFGTTEGFAATADSKAPRLRLALEEVAVGVTKGFLRLEAAASSGAEGQLLAQEIERQLTSEEVDPDATWTMPPLRRQRLRVFQDLWERGYFVTFGSKFGADFLIYKGDPKKAHAVALIIVKSYDEEFARADVVSFCRVAKMVKKQLLFACVQPLDGGERTNFRKEDASNDSDGTEAWTNRIVYISLSHALLVSHQEENDG
ncbi:hypothetical protein PHYBOEH_002769 [Phytophthora boehmeriae]|uniref:tRNA intron endonuclease catalytic domain-containing protein n=1 Tax=Phytophthora boehmeriae TaxID=109152 RepID=A0A8T1WTY4_9STRA|nr:hypothetical protein PHYBOEH_002769 [Phytophthora boehmeriae]